MCDDLTPLENAIKILRRIDVDEESDIACYRDEAILFIKKAEAEALKIKQAYENQGDTR